MKCSYCGSTESKVLDSRATDDFQCIRRRRECVNCGRRFTTYETIETTPILVVKNDGTRETFDINKLKSGIIKACEKRPISMQVIDDFVNDIQKKINNDLTQEISSKQLGEMVMSGLKDIDEIAYVRFASVYKQFKDIATFLSEIENMLQK